MTHGDSSQASNAWRVAAGSFVALILSGAPLIVYTQSIFLGPMIKDFGWSHAQYFLPLSIAGVLSALASPLIGYLTDRLGVRRVLLPGIVLFSLSYGALAYLNGSLVIYSALIFCVLLFQGAHGVLLYSKAVALWPTPRPGLSLALTLAGTAVGGIVVPPLTVHLMEAYGWRGARLGLAAATLLISLTAAWLFVKTPTRVAPATVRQSLETVGIPAQAALRTGTFWSIFLAIGLSGAAVNGLLGNVVVVLTQHGFTARLSAVALSVIAVAQLCARFCSGWMLDRFPTAKTGIPWFLFSMAGIAVVATTDSAPAMLLGMALLGAGLGAEVQLAAYFTRRYFGLSSFGQLSGYTLGFYSIGATSGPLILGFTFDRTGSYISGVIMLEAMLLAAALLLLRLGPYVFGMQDLGTVTVASGRTGSPTNRVMSHR